MFWALVPEDHATAQAVASWGPPGPQFTEEPLPHFNRLQDSALRAIAGAVSVLGVLVLGPVGAADAATGPALPCTSVAGPAELQSPVAFGAFVGALAPGQVGCLPPGTYGAVNERFIMAIRQPGAPITLRALDYAKKPTIHGELLLAGDSITVSGLTFDGPAGCDSPPPYPCVQMAPLVINGNNVEVNRSEVRNSTSHEGIHVGNNLLAPPPVNVRLVRDYVHDNGLRSDRTRANLDHGINWVQGSGSIANSVIVHNYAYGVHLAPFAKNVRVTLNTIVGNGHSGVIIADCDPRENSPLGGLHCATPPNVDFATNNLVDNNIIANNCTDLAFSQFCSGVGSFLLTFAGNGNRVRNNLFFHNYVRKHDQACDGRPRCKPKGPRGLSFSSNTNANPRFVGGSRFKGAARFVLRAGSPAIGRAVVPSSRDLKTGDFAGRSRPSPKRTRPDQGAFESARRPR